MLHLVFDSVDTCISLYFCTNSFLLPSFFTLISDILIKKVADAHNAPLLGLSIVLYALGAIIWYLVYQSAKFSTVGVMFSVLTLLLSIITGFVYFHEKVTSTGIVGIVLGGISVLLLSRGG